MPCLTPASFSLCHFNNFQFVISDESGLLQEIMDMKLKSNKREWITHILKPPHHYPHHRILRESLQQEE